MSRGGASFWIDRNGYEATWRWWLRCLWFDLKCMKQRICRAVLGRNFIRKNLG
jgi:hypothetical protein